MAISTYAELQTALANWTARSDLTSRLPEFISLVEADINRKVRTRDQETKNATFSITGEYVNVPSDFLEVKEFYLNTSPKQVLSFMPGDTQTQIFGSGSGKPKYFDITAGQFRFGPPPDATYSATLIYYAKVASLSAGVNWLITSHPDLYLYGSLHHAGQYLKDDAERARVTEYYQQALDSLSQSDNRSRWGGNGMAVRIG